ncbi:MAG: DUF4147 domain-containing protein [Candidatus Aenigmatarchaeota archaeon]
MIIKNFSNLALSKDRSIALEIIEAGLKSLDYSKVLTRINFNFAKYKNIFLIGFGKGSAEISKILGKKINFSEGYVIDLKKPKDFPQKINFYQGTHPLPSRENFEFTKKVIERFEGRLTKDDLVVVVICGGGSAMFVYPAKISLERKIQINQELLKSGANIYEMNIVRKHMSLVKGGGLCKVLYPAKVLSLIVSDVPGNDLSIIASGPTVKDLSTKDDALKIIKKYDLSVIKGNLIETPKEGKYFENVENKLILSNLTALEAMKEKAKELGFIGKILSDNLKGEVRKVAKELLEKIQNSKEKIILFGGETTVKVKGKGKGGRNLELVLWFLKYAYLRRKNKIKPLIISINSDGWDNTEYAGGIGDELTIKKSIEKKLKIDEFLKNNDSFNFFKKVKDGIITGRLNVNVSDIILVMK